MGSLKVTLTPSGRNAKFKLETLNSLLAFCWSFGTRESLLYWEEVGALPLPCSLSSSNLLCSSILLISWCMFSGGHMVRESLNFDSCGSSSLNVLTATCSFPFHISLYSSQYLFAYDWKVSPLPILMDNNTSIG